jgi:hypothetical protein
LLIFTDSLKPNQPATLRGGDALNPGEKELLKKAITYILIARGAGHIANHALLNGETFKSEVVLPLMTMAEWSESDQIEVEKEIAEFSDNSGGKTLHEKSDLIQKQIDKRWKIGATGIGIAGIAGAAYLLLKKKE